MTTHAGPDGGRLAWSPDSKTVAYTQGSEPKYSAYNQPRLAVVNVNDPVARVLTAKLDRGVASPQFSADGKSIYVLVNDDRSEYRARVSVDTGDVERVSELGRVIVSQAKGGDHVAVLMAGDSAPAEVFALDGDKPRKLTSHNDALLAELKLGVTEEFSCRTRDGNEVHGMVTKPPSFEAGKKYPTLLRIHGGPNGQDAHAFQFERHFLAANGYVVINVNYRGSSGRGAAYGQSIFGDWG